MAKRSKPNPYIVENIKQAEGTLAELAALNRKVTEINLAMQEAIDLEKAKASQASTPLVARRKELEAGLAVYAKLNRQEVFGKAKSRDLGFGTIGFRASTQIKQQKGVTVDMTLERLQNFGFLEGIRLKKEVDKEAMSGWPNERLETVGLTRQQSDTFFIEIAKDEMPKGVEV